MDSVVWVANCSEHFYWFLPYFEKEGIRIGNSAADNPITLLWANNAFTRIYLKPIDCSSCRIITSHTLLPWPRLSPVWNPPEKSPIVSPARVYFVRHQKGAIEMQKIKSFDDLLKTIRTLCFWWEREHRKHHDAPLDCVSLSLSTPQERIRFCVASAKTMNAWPGGGFFSSVLHYDFRHTSRLSNRKELGSIRPRGGRYYY